MRKCLSVGLAALLIAGPALAKDAPEIADLAFLEGCWQGTAFGGDATECWVSGPGAHMTGMFQLAQDGKTVFTELMHLADFADGPALRVKHFTPDLIGWEEKDDFVSFALKETGPEMARFDGLIITLTADGDLIFDLTLESSQDGQRHEERIVYRRMP